ncbi:MAG: hypothetical protein AAEC10_07055 [Rhodospirillales bacterium]
MLFRPHVIVSSALVVLVLVLVLAQPSATKEINHAKKYQDCIVEQA